MFLRCFVTTLPRLRHGVRRLTSRHGVATSSHVVASPLPDVVIPDVNLSEFVWQRMDEWPDHTAIECGVSGRGYTYTALRTACRRFAASLHRAGLQRGHVIAIVLPNVPEYAVAFLGAVEAGVVVTTVNPGYVPAEIAKQLLDSDARLIVTLPEKYGQVMEACSLLRNRNPDYKQPLIVVTHSYEGQQAPPGTIKIEEMIDSGVSTDSVDSNYSVTATTPLVIPYSSGTTGLPKGVLLSHRNIIGNCLQLHSHDLVDTTSPTSGNYQDVIPAVLPLYHIYGLVIVFLAKLRLGNKIVTLPKFEPTTYLNVLKTKKPTILFLVPPLVLFLGSSPAATPAHFETVRYMITGAAPLGEKDMERFKEKTPPQLQCMQAYGLTETSPTVFHQTMMGNKLASVGIPLPNVIAKIADPDTGEALEAGKVGEVCLLGPQNMVGYHNNPKATQEMIGKDGWLHTGDLGYYDDDKDFYIVDRLKELIKVKGLQVAPAELEEVLRSHPGVLDAAVIGIPDERAGERPLAYVIPRKQDSLDEKQVMEFVATQTSAHKHLSGVRFVKNIPKSAAGKILRKMLREEMAKELAEKS